MKNIIYNSNIVTAINIWYWTDVNTMISQMTCLIYTYQQHLSFYTQLTIHALTSAGCFFSSSFKTLSKIGGCIQVRSLCVFLVGQLLTLCCWAFCIVVICCATTDSTSTSIRLNSSKHAQAPELQDKRQIRKGRRLRLMTTFVTFNSEVDNTLHWLPLTWPILWETCP